MKRQAKHFWVILAICAACTGATLWLTDGRFAPRVATEALAAAENYTQDLRLRLCRKTPFNENLVLIGVDRAAYADYFSEAEMQATPALRAISQPYPWSRDVWAALITKLADAGAKAIVIDLVFAAPKEGDDALAAALEKYRDRIVIGYAFDLLRTEQENYGCKFGNLLLPSESIIVPAAGRSAVEDDRLGFVTIWPDEDDVLREAHFRNTGAELGDILPPSVMLESLAARALRKFGRPELIPAGTEPRRFRYTAPGGTYKPALIGDVLLPKTWEHNYGNGAFFKDKLVLIGPTATVLQDKHNTPLGTMPGPEIHLNIINAALHGEFLRETSLRANLFIIALAGFLAAALCFVFREPMKRLIVVIALCVGYCLLANYLFANAGIFIPAAGPLLILPVAAPLLVLFIGSVVVLSFDFLLERMDKARIRKKFERYVSKDVVRELLDNPQTFTGVRKPVTILFSDVRGFTTLTESADSALLVKQLNEYFEEMVKLVFAHHGSLDKFIGDAVMAVWGNIVSENPAQDAKRAVATALAMRRSLEDLNADWKKRGMTELHIGIGINQGEVIVGEMGSAEKAEITVIGDAVNLASRLEGLTKEYHLDLLLGENMAALVGDQYLLRLVDCVQVKGKTKPVDVYMVMGDGAGQTVSLPLWLARYEEGVRRYRERKFAEAAALFEESLRRQPEDYLSAMYLQRCRALIENPPGDDWDGVFVMTKK